MTGPEGNTPKRASYASASAPSPPPPPAPASNTADSLGSRRAVGQAPVPASNFFSSTSSSRSTSTSHPRHSTSTSTRLAPTSSETSTLGMQDVRIEDASDRDESRGTRDEQPRPRVPPPPATNPWNRTTTVTSQNQTAPGEKEPEVVHEDSTATPSTLNPSSTSILSTSPSHELSQLDVTIEPASPEPASPSLSVSTVVPPQTTASARPECGNDGRWTTPRLLAKEGEGGSKAGIWEWDAFDFEVEDTPKDGKYKAMGEWVERPTGEVPNEGTVEVGDLVDVELPSDESPRAPKNGFQTIERQELDMIRPHPNLFFCCDTLSWGLFSKLPIASTDPSSERSPTHSQEVRLWQFNGMDAHRRNLPAHESIHSALFEDLDPPLPDPILPFDPNSLRTAPHYTFPPRHHPALRALKLSLATSTKQDRVMFSTQEFFPSVLGQELWKNLLRTRSENPQPGQSASQAEAASINFLWRALDDALFKGETRALPIKGKTFSKAMPWDDVSCDVFLSVLGYRLLSDGTAIQAPEIDRRSDEGATNRERLLRAWLEFGIWLTDYFTRTGDITIKRDTRIKLSPAKSRMVALAGGDDLTKLDSSQAWTLVNSSLRSNPPSSKASTIDPLAAQYSMLGCTPDLSDDSIIRVYDTQIATWPSNAPEFLEALLKISNARGAESLSTKVVLERSKGLAARSELDKAYSELRLPASSPHYDYLGEDELSQLFDRRLEAVTHPERRKVLKEALHVIAQHKRSDTLRAILLSLTDTEPGIMQGVEMEKMDPEKAYKALEIERGMDDEMIAMVYQVRRSDAKDDAERNKMRAALEVIAGERGSEQLKSLAKEGESSAASTSHDGWQVAAFADRNLPVGLTNIANTCYLNSLLQYFFTVRELREAVLAFARNGQDASSEQIRVGGRLVTTREVERSQRFVLLLQALFNQLIHSSVPAVTPETELAYLALVPGKEEYEAESLKEKNSQKPTDDDDDLIIIEPGDIAKEKDKLTGNKSPSVLGKRTTDEKEEEVPMLVDVSLPSTSTSASQSATLSDEVENVPGSDAEMAEASSRPSLSRASSSTVASTDERTAKRGRSVDQLAPADQSLDEAPAVAVGPVDPTLSSSVLPTATTDSSSSPPPPLPPRPPPRPSAPERKQTKEEKLEAEVSSYMAFGRQNDVTECMDNVMFQLEAALKANVLSERDQSVGSLVKRTFYGSNRQKLVFDDPTSTSEPIRTQDEPFSSLLVDVPPTSFDRDLYDGLDAVFDDAPVEIEGKLARRTISLVDLPPVLQIQLQRVQYDREQGRIFKSNAHLRFPDDLNLGRYVEVDDSDSTASEKKLRTNTLRSDLASARTRLAQLEQNTSQSQQLRDALDHLGSISNELGDLVSPSLAEDTAMEAQDLDNEIVSLRRRVREIREEMLAVWKDGNDGQDYELRAVFFHRGTASSGHYYISQRDSAEPNRWLKYNDSVITNIDRDEIFRETTGDTNAYFLVYCRRDRLDAIETIKREVA